MVVQYIRGYLPRSLRKALRAVFTPVRGQWIAVERLRPRRSYQGKDVVVVGIFRSGTGLGRAAELVALTLEAEGANVVRVDVTGELELTAMATNADGIQSVAEAAQLTPTDLVFVLNPNFSRALGLFSRQWLLRCCVIGHWIWELEQLPPEWRREAPSFDEIWAPTELVADSIRSSLKKYRGPIRVVPYATGKAAFPPPDSARRDEVRRRFRIDRGAKVLGYAFSASSNYERKNPEAAIDVFHDVFRDGDRRGVLVLRCQDFDRFPEERRRLLARMGDDDRIRLVGLEERMTISEFYALIDVLVSPARAEGYGLTLVEAAQAGIPAVTASWRLAPEILAVSLIHAVGYDLVPVRDPQHIYSDIPDARWAEPRVDEMARAVREICLGGSADTDAATGASR
jgi:glycosyltransferase involved in cell wall biosynthesis